MDVEGLQRPAARPMRHVAEQVARRRVEHPRLAHADSILVGNDLMLLARLWRLAEPSMKRSRSWHW